MDRIFSLALAAGLLVLAVSTAIGFGHGFAGIGPRLVAFERVTVTAKRTLSAPGAATVADNRH